MKWFVENHVSRTRKEKIRVLDVGSYDVNGSYRHLFPEDRYEYVGLDMAPGPNVDLVLKRPYDWSELKTDSFDVVISGQAFEHMEFFWVTMVEMARVLDENGLLCIVAPNGFGEHRYPVDCYRFFSDGMVSLARYVNLEPLHVHTNAAPTAEGGEWHSENEADSVLIARKPYSGPARIVDLASYTCTPADLESLRSGMIPYQPRKGVMMALKEKVLGMAAKMRG